MNEQMNEWTKIFSFTVLARIPYGPSSIIMLIENPLCARHCFGPGRYSKKWAASFYSLEANFLEEEI